MPSRTPLRRLGFLLAAAASLLPLACGGDAPPTRVAVVQRGLAWSRAGGEAPPLSRTWTCDDASTAWTVSGAASSTEHGKLLAASTTGQIELDAPRGAVPDPSVHHWLSLAVQTRAVEHFRLQWRRRGETWSDAAASSPFAVQGEDDEPQVYAIPLESLRGVGAEGRDLAEGADQFRVVFSGPPGRRLVIQVDTIALLSDFDRPEPAGPALHDLQAGGVHQSGVLLPAPGALAAPLAPGPHERLRLSLAAVGGRQPVSVTVGDEQGRLRPVTVSLSPGGGWEDVVLDLHPLAGRTGTLHLAATGGGPSSAVLVGGVLRLAPEPRPLPDVVLYVEDTLRADRLSVYGHARATDPVLSRLAEQGVVFEHVFAASSWTRPSLSSLLTSLPPPVHGNVTHRDRVHDDVTTLAEALAAEGYQTASFVTNYHGGRWAGLAQGFDSAREPPFAGASALASTLTSAAVDGPLREWLAARAGERVFVLVHSLDPHEPYAPPDEDLVAVAPRHAGPAPEPLLYEGEVHHNDRMLGRLVQALAERDAAGGPGTLLAFTSDHGESFGERGVSGHRNGLHQEELAVPWVLHAPGRLLPRRVSAPAAHVDLAPTVLGLLGLPPPADWRGRDLSPLLLAGARPPADVPLVSHVVFDAPRDGVAAELAVVRWPHKLLASLGTAGEPDPRALFDLTADPGERTSLLHDPSAASVLATLLDDARAALAEGRAAAGAASATQMDADQRRWMEQLGYLGR